MKVIQILYSGLGGHGSVAFSLLDAARTAGAWSNELMFVGIEPVLGEYERICQSGAIPHQYVRVTAGRAWTAWPAVYRALRRSRPEAIVLHSVKTILPCALYARWHGIPLVAVEHQPNALKHRGEWWASRLVMRLADSVVVLTEDYRAQLREGLGDRWVEGKVHLIPNGIDTTAFAPGATAPAGDRPRRIGMAARMTGMKRQDLLIGAMALLRDRDGPGAWRLSLAGDGETLPALRSQVADLGLGDVVEFPGYLGESALRDWFGSLDVYAHASEGETLSTSLLQALAMGLPILGSDVPGIDNLLAAGGGAGLVVPQTAAAFAEACLRVRAEPVLEAELRGRARALAVAEFSQVAMFQRYDRVLGKLCPG